MTKYSDGPFMNISPTGAPGLLIVIFTVFGLLTLVTPRHWHPILLVVALAVAGAVFVVGLHEALRPVTRNPPPSLVGLSDSAGTSDGSEEPLADSTRATQPGTDGVFRRWRRYRWFGREAVVIIVAAAITLVAVIVFGPSGLWEWLVGQP